MGNNSILTVSVPYIPPFDSDICPPSYFEEKIKAFGKGMPDIKDFELHEIQGTRLVYFEDSDEWIDLGHNAIYRRKEQVTGLVPPDSEANTDSSNSPTEATQERKEAAKEEKP